MSATMTDAPTAWARPWATAKPFARPTPRAGAWYPVVGEASNDRVVLEIRGRKVAVQRKLLEIRPKRPKTFTVVVRSRETSERMLGATSSLDRVYAVCPACMHRVRITREQVAAVCDPCGHRGEIAWWETG